MASGCQLRREKGISVHKLKVKASGFGMPAPEREGNLCPQTEDESEWLRAANTGEREENLCPQLKVKANGFGSPTVVVEKV